MNAVDAMAGDRPDRSYEDLLGAAAFGTLDAGEAADLEGYLATSAAARMVLAELRMIASGLPLLVDEVSPSPRLRSRIEQAVLADVAWARPAPRGYGRDDGPDDAIVPLSTVPVKGASKPTPLWRPYLWAAVAALLLAVLAGVVLDRLLLDAGDPAIARESIAFSLSLSTPVPELRAELVYDPEDQFFILETENMPAAPLDHVYQVWLIDDSGPQPVGVMNQSRFVVPAPRDAYDIFAITVEPAPLGSTGPTSDPFFVAPLISEDAPAS
ncbi:MAG: anti-sigma factor [Chloroflexia bacterium]|nr:anti-sigma factor [Chloroflexia bacterium]